LTGGAGLPEEVVESVFLAILRTWPESPALVDFVSSRVGLDRVISRGPFQPQELCNSLRIKAAFLNCVHLFNHS